MRLSPRVVTLGAVVAVRSDDRLLPRSAAAPRLLPAEAARVRIAQARSGSAPRARCTGAASPSRQTAPADGFVTRPARRPRPSDWDLAVVDGRPATSSTAPLGSARTRSRRRAVRGQELVIQSCRRTGVRHDGTQSVQFTRADRRDDAQVKLVRVASAPTSIAKSSRRSASTAPTTRRRATRTCSFTARRTRRSSRSPASPSGRARPTCVPRTARTGSRPARRGRSARGASTARAATPGGRTRYRTLAEIEQELKELRRRQPDLVRLFTLPRQSIEGRQIMGIEIAENVTAPPDGRPALRHGRHPPRPRVARQRGDAGVRPRADQRLQGRQRRRSTGSSRAARTFVIPVLNVDGFDATIESEGLNPGRLLRGPGRLRAARAATRASGTAPTSARTAATQRPAEQAIPCLARTYDAADRRRPVGQNDRGVDLNRNYGVVLGRPGHATRPSTT